MNEIKQYFTALHHDENGDAPQTVLILLLAVIIILALVKVLLPSVWDAVVQRIQGIFQSDSGYKAP